MILKNSLDNDGNIIEIQVVGERDVNKCFFKVKDIMNGFGLNNLHKTIIDKRKDGYIENTHYKYFYSANFVQDENGRLKKIISHLQRPTQSSFRIQ